MKQDHCIIRAYRDQDRERVRDICRRTGQKGQQAQDICEDLDITTMLFADYYLDHEPDACFVAEVEGQVVGYVLGSKDTRKYTRLFWRKMVPRLVGRVMWKIVTFQYRRRTTYRTLWWAMTRGWPEMPNPPVDQYPAHGHFNVEAGFRGQQIGLRLVGQLIQYLQEQKIRGLHGVILEEEGTDKSATMRRRVGMTVGATKRFSLLEKSTRKKWHTKVLLIDLTVPNRINGTYV